MTERLIAIMVVGIIGITLTAVRRWKNENPKAGMGVAGWTMVAIVLIASDTA